VPYEFRPPNPAHPPNARTVALLETEEFQRHVNNPLVSCEELAEELFHAAEKEGGVLRIIPRPRVMLHVPEASGISTDFAFHEVYTDSRYVFDPRLQMIAIPKSDYVRLLRQLNPGVSITILKF